jgi:hypothetical protein
MTASISLRVSLVARLGGPPGKVELVRSYFVGVRDSEEPRPRKLVRMRRGLECQSSRLVNNTLYGHGACFSKCSCINIDMA